MAAPASSDGGSDGDSDGDGDGDGDDGYRRDNDDACALLAFHLTM